VVSSLPILPDCGRDEAVRGTGEKFIGDATMAMLGLRSHARTAPEPAVRAALGDRRGDRRLNQATPALELQVRISVSTEEARWSSWMPAGRGEAMASKDAVILAPRCHCECESHHRRV
jgi:hypothetical protein